MAEADHGLLVEMFFDEFKVQVDFTYQGQPIELATQCPSSEEIRTLEDGHLRLAGFLLRRNADNVYSTKSRESRSCASNSSIETLTRKRFPYFETPRRSRRAQLCMPIEMVAYGRATKLFHAAELFHASELWSTMS